MSDLNVLDQKDFESCNLKSTTVSSKDADDISRQVHDEKAELSKIDNTDEPRCTLQESLKCKMYMFFRELCFLFLLVFTYAAFQNNTPKTSKSPNAFRFFPASSIVKDWYQGQLNEAIDIASESDLAFVMYYAPWDAESQTVRYEFEYAAQIMHHQVHFAAINCWHPGSECRQQFNKFYSWPVLMAYPAHGRGIQYQGPRKAEHMLSFLQFVSNPLVRINSYKEFYNYRTQHTHDAYVIGQMNTELGSSDYGVYYTAALRFLERDPFREVAFLILTEKATSNPRRLEVYLWNSTKFYVNSEWTPDALVTWISDSIHQILSWNSPPGGKSISLSNYLQPGPALILFTPRNPLYSMIDYYTVLYEVALDYYDLENIVIHKFLASYYRQAYMHSYRQQKAKCISNKRTKKELKKFTTVINYDVKKMWMNTTCDSKNVNNLNKKSSCFEFNKKGDTCSNIIFAPTLPLNKESYKTTENENKKSLKNRSFSIIFGDENDPRSPKNLQKLHEIEKCRYFRLAYELHPAIFAPLRDENNESIDIHGLVRKTNASLSMIALDSLQYHYFAEGLGIDILNIEDKSAVVILNPAMETHYVMQKPFSVENLQKFIYDFTKGTLERTLNSAVTQRQFTHHYFNEKFCNSKEGDNICIKELNTSNFSPTIMQTNLAVVVMYYSTKCAFCSGVSHTLLTTAKILQSVKELQFSRIDGDNHALPWEFAMHHYPSILYFPPRRKSESRVFPQNVPITVPNIISFILANADSHMKIHMMWAICKDAKFNEDLQSCIRTIKTECITFIGKLLQVYRLSDDIQQRTHILKQLQHLRSLHFLLENPSNIEAIQKHVYSLRYVEIVPKKFRRNGNL